MTLRRGRGPVSSTRQRRYQIMLLGLVLVLVLSTGFLSGLIVEREFVDEAPVANTFDDVTAVGDLIEDNYYYRPIAGEDQSGFETSLERNAINGMLSGLDDEYTRYLVPDQAQVASEELTGEYGGIGVNTVIQDNQLVVSDVVPNTPASRAGIAEGDRISRIDNRPVVAGSEELVEGDLRGPVGSVVSLELIKVATGRPQSVPVTRETIIVTSVSAMMMPGTTYALIRITVFGNRTTRELDAALAASRQAGATGLILDLRGNGGGWVTAAQETIGRFVASTMGPALYEDSVPGRGGAVQFPILAAPGGTVGLPMIVIVDGNTASAAEIVAGALRDYDRALIVGTRTFGKGSVQRIFDFPDGASLRVTVAEWFTPSRGRIQGEGITPDVVISGPPDSSSAGDTPVSAAITLLDQGLTHPTSMVRDEPGSPAATPLG